MKCNLDFRDIYCGFCFSILKCPEHVQFFSNDALMFVLGILKRLSRTFDSRGRGFRKRVRSPSGPWVIVLGASLNESHVCKFCEIVTNTQSLPKSIFSRFPEIKFKTVHPTLISPFQDNLPGVSALLQEIQFMWGCV